MNDEDLPAEKKRKIKAINLVNIEKAIVDMKMPGNQEEIEDLRKKQIEEFGAIFDEEVKWLKNLF